MIKTEYKLDVVSNKTHDELFCKGNNSYKLFEPGMCFLSPWIFSPLYLTDKAYLEEYSKRYFEKLLSFDYWMHWRKRRPPITVVLPNKQTWCLDERINNTDRNVLGVFPLISVSEPLIVGDCCCEINNGKLLVQKPSKEKPFIDNLVVY